MDKKLKIVIPVIAGAVAITTGIGAAFAGNAEKGLTAELPAASYDAASSVDAPYGARYGYHCGGNGGMMGFGYGAGFGVTQQLADLLNTTPADLRARLEDGATLAEIATEQGVAQDQLIETIMAPFNDHIDLMVKYGYVTEDEAITLRQQARERVQAAIAGQYGEWGDWHEQMEELMEEYGCPGFGWGAGGTDENTARGSRGGGMMGGWGGMHGAWGGMMR